MREMQDGLKPTKGGGDGGSSNLKHGDGGTTILHNGDGGSDGLWPDGAGIAFA